MLNRTDLQLMACDIIKTMSTEELIGLVDEDLQIYDEEQEFVEGSFDSEDAEDLKFWLEFMLVAVNERIQATAE